MYSSYYIRHWDIHGLHHTLGQTCEVVHAERHMEKPLRETPADCLCTCVQVPVCPNVHRALITSHAGTEMYTDDKTLHHTIIDWRQNITGKAELDTHTLCAAIGRESW